MSIAPMQVLNRNEKSPSNLRQPNEKWLSVPIGSGNTLTLTNLQVEISALLKKNLNLPKYFTACMMPRTESPKPPAIPTPDSP
ncbi:hypothetical protein, partial [Rothia sp. (in: high G+C Gram-positive bacteria)]|uniref:hypothetical protein n=1 Tax=Rothia sp. (in: high G+C Gram-positive bacteria) TaxID=1885016 RepID=UPI002600A9D4